MKRATKRITECEVTTIAERVRHCGWAPAIRQPAAMDVGECCAASDEAEPACAARAQPAARR